MEKFWMVLKDGTNSTTVRHYPKQTAIEEAIRLCNKEPNSIFIILEAVTIVHKQPMPTVVEEVL